MNWGMAKNPGGGRWETPQDEAPKKPPAFWGGKKNFGWVLIKTTPNGKILTGIKTWEIRHEEGKKILGRQTQTKHDEDGDVGARPKALSNQ